MGGRMEIKNIHPTAVIGDNVIIECNEFTLGANSVIKDGCTIRCNKFIAQEGLYMCEGVEIGRGGCNGPNSNVYIGSNVGIFERAIINPSDEVHIGDNVGIGGEVMIWTHGAWLDITKGFPADFGPVKIGNNVWLPARSIVLPNVEIGDDTVIGIGSVVNKNIPAGSLAAGSPCKVIKENEYPKELSTEELEKLIEPALKYWHTKLIPHKGIVGVNCVNYNATTEMIELAQGSELYQATYYDVRKKTMFGYINDVAEDLRDFLRRRGIKIFTNKPFKSI